MENLLIYTSAMTITTTAMVHSIFGEKYLIKPLLAPHTGSITSLQERRILRYAWHLTTILMVLTAVILCLTPQMKSNISDLVIFAIGATYLSVGILDGILTRGKHIRWWFLTASGIFALTALF